MEQRLQDLIVQIKALQGELIEELNKGREEFLYEVSEKKIYFKEEITRQHRAIRQKIKHYFLSASWLNVLTAPIIWACLPPALLLDLCVTIYQTVCFPIYGVPKVVRSQYIVIDRHSLAYLNIIEKLNCVYCGYFNGLIAYIQEIAARTEQYWCPIKHARRIAYFHSRYDRYFEYGNAEAYCSKKEELRRSFEDLSS